jgi:hypothetical protein
MRTRLRSALQDAASLPSSAVSRLRSSLASPSPLSISCALCNYLTLLAYYPINLALYLLFSLHFDAWTRCYDLQRYLVYFLLLFLLLLLWRLCAHTRPRLREPLLLLLLVAQLYVNWHGWQASKQAIRAFRSSQHPEVTPVLPPDPYPPSSLLSAPSFPYALDSSCGRDDSIHEVRVVLVDVAFTSAACLAYVLRMTLNRVSEERKEGWWTLWDALVDWVEDGLAKVRRRAIKRRNKTLAALDSDDDDDDDESQWFLRKLPV